MHTGDLDVVCEVALWCTASSVSVALRMETIHAHARIRQRPPSWSVSG